MQRRNNKDYLEKLINYTMQHGKKVAAIGLVAKSVSMFVQKLAHQGTISNSVPLRRISNRPRLSSALLNNQQLSSALNQLKSFGSHPTTTLQLVPHGSIKSNLSTINSPTLLFLTMTSTTQSTKVSSQLRYATDVSSSFEKTEDWSLNSTQKPVEIEKGRGINAKSEKISVRKGKRKVATRSVERLVKDAISNLKPSLETRKKKIAGITRHIPSVVHPSRGEGLAIRWIIAAAKERQRREGKDFTECLSNQLLDAYLKKGEPRQKRDSLHKLAENNRSYIRFRWW
jgi:small subunit ribosomal protein S7